MVFAVLAWGGHSAYEAFFHYSAYGVIAGRPIQVPTTVAGVGKFVHVEEGQTVKQGQLLMTLHSTEIDRDLGRLDDSLRMAQAKLQAGISRMKWELSLHDKDAGESEGEFFEKWGQFKQEQARLKGLQQTLQRSEELHAKKMVPLHDVQHARNEELGQREKTEYEYCPTMALLLVGHNEGDSIEAGLLSVWGRYPRMEIVIVDDGSSDDMAANARRFARDHEGVLVLSRAERGGKSSALNWALAYTRAEIVLCVDTDSHLSDTSLWEIVQPFTDPTVGAVSACVEARNSLDNLCTWMQAYEYRQTIYLGRLLQERLGMLAIVSGAFGAFRRSLLEQVGAWMSAPVKMAT